ncbi:hypothetical protein FB45DRAFT_1065102 [Roridomyces roridus]|uniref:Uncharacterized protein n=1 Tax=Roridomyces roridus TaxID=1738132 RepID=A0AAD7B8G5_9AGAR|nr:hypothetical protein FB45DRAFT_1065102 [Roridomyces roridus]
MFPPFENVSQYRPGIIIWCDPSSEPNSLDMELSTRPSNAQYINRKKLDLRPCLVVAVDFDSGTIQVARLCDTMPYDTTHWVRVDTVPPIRWKVGDAWIWVGTPAVLPMLLGNSRLQHPHRDPMFSSQPVAEANLKSYRVHRKNYQSYPAPWSQPSGSNLPPHGFIPRAPYQGPGPSMQHTMATSTPYTTRPEDILYSTQSSPSATPSSHDIAVASGFTETNPNAPGWLRNPQNGWFWHANRGLFPPSFQPGYGHGSSG